jgi:hypothetical protein
LRERDEQARAELRSLQEENNKAAYIYDTMKKESENLVKKSREAEYGISIDDE